MDSSMHSFHSTPWPDYQLIDAGNGEKLEKIGKYTLVRPEPKAIWDKTLDHSFWNKIDARYERNPTGGGKWIYKTNLDQSWTVRWNDLTFSMKPTGFKHIGIFPEQSGMWEYIIRKIKSANRPINVLNLFAYTGGSTLAAASAGAKVTHIDSAKDIITWARENAQLSHLEDKPIRWIPEDVMKFVKREVQRGNTYDAIIMDPPKFGRGSKNEVWKIEDDLPKLFHACAQLLSGKPLFFIVNAYAVSYSSLTLRNLLSQTMKTFKGKIFNGELVLQPVNNSLVLPMSIYALWES